jgi:tetratricopeptide (TPR) repeat protein
MRKQLISWLLGILLAVVVVGCSKSSTTLLGPLGPSYQQLIAEGWNSFSQAQIQDAVTKIKQAQSLDPSQMTAYMALGWIYMKWDSLAVADGQFSNGSTKTGEDSIKADLNAGWAFLLNAEKSYSSSNAKADTALGIEPGWSFPYLAGLNWQDLHVVKAENHYLLGNFNQSLAEVKLLNPGFSLTTIITPADQAALANEIERLKGTLSKKIRANS